MDEVEQWQGRTKASQSLIMLSAAVTFVRKWLETFTHLRGFIEEEGGICEPNEMDAWRHRQGGSKFACIIKWHASSGRSKKTENKEKIEEDTTKLLTPIKFSKESSCSAEPLPPSYAEPCYGHPPLSTLPNALLLALLWLFMRLWLPKMPGLSVDTAPLTTQSMKMPQFTMPSRNSQLSTLDALLSPTRVVCTVLVFVSFSNCRRFV